MNITNDFIVRPPTLDRWEVRVNIVSTGPLSVREVVVQGWCNRRRRPLFSWSEYVTAEDGPMGVTDRVHHAALVCEQDRPTSSEAFERGLIGEHWDQLEIPYPE